MVSMSNALPANTTDAAEFYANGYVRSAMMANLPDWALREFLGRHAGPALESARDEAAHRGWSL
jgi:6-phosphogluconate dehydrogenase